MQLHLYSIYDNVAQMFNRPFVAHNDNDAVRSFSQSVRDQPHKNDYVLYGLGSFTDHNGTIESLSVPKKILTGFDVKNPVLDAQQPLNLGD